MNYRQPFCLLADLLLFRDDRCGWTQGIAENANILGAWLFVHGARVRVARLSQGRCSSADHSISAFKIASKPSDWVSRGWFLQLEWISGCEAGPRRRAAPRGIQGVQKASKEASKWNKRRMGSIASGCLGSNFLHFLESGNASNMPIIAAHDLEEAHLSLFVISNLQFRHFSIFLLHFQYFRHFSIFFLHFQHFSRVFQMATFF